MPPLGRMNSISDPFDSVSSSFIHFVKKIVVFVFVFGNFKGACFDRKLVLFSLGAIFHIQPTLKNQRL